MHMLMAFYGNLHAICVCVFLCVCVCMCACGVCACVHTSKCVCIPVYKCVCIFCSLLGLVQAVLIQSWQHSSQMLSFDELQSTPSIVAAWLLQGHHPCNDGRHVSSANPQRGGGEGYSESRRGEL